MIRTIDLVAPPLVCANGRRPWEAPNGGRKKRRRETDAEGKDEGADEAHDDTFELSKSAGTVGAEKVRSTAMDAWEMQMFQMLVLQGLTQSTRHKGVPSLPPALACQLCQMSYDELIDFFGCHPHLSKIQSAFIYLEGSSPLSHAWTLEHLEAVCRACLEINRPTAE
eukprot:CAMPEP_0173105998 /NCGR_PEP_ID=MMETSP1102-20130122/40598_1 /TAXON_ID=49646 /ORGANISM="Geminigera sp., Strain Caron Lab Isolate" /LENGTH=166 /DNA_ID=CAMNT_0014002669 /DNA_START=257 /DNA_END=754 /DNA_ORIENTATION=-